MSEWERDGVEKAGGGTHEGGTMEGDSGGSQRTNVARDRAYQFALRVTAFCRELRARDEFVLADQLLRSGTSIGANLEEAGAAYSRKDFSSKLAIASKEARESAYWLRLVRDSDLCDRECANSLIAAAEELVRILTAGVKTAQSRSASQARARIARADD